MTVNYIQLTNNKLGRALHDVLYERITSFAQQYTPEFPAEIAAREWLARLYKGDMSLIILVDLDEQMRVIGHTVIEVLNNYGHTVIFCHQTIHDKNMKEHLEYGLAYLDNMAKVLNATCISLNVTKHQKALQEKYKYQIARTTMIKYANKIDEGEIDA